LAGGVRVASNPTAGRTNLGPSFPPPPTVAGSNERSMLSSSQPTESDGQWDSVWGTTPKSPATIGGDDSTGMVALPPRMRPATVMASQQLPPPPAGNTGPTAPPLDPRYQSASSSQPPTNTGADDWANFKRPQDNVFNDPRMPAAGQLPQQPVLTSQQQPPMGQRPPAEQPLITTANNNPPPAATTPEEVPWKPLLAVSLALAGSIGANFYLGMSYAEARHRYRTLVAKTTHAFEKKAGLAA
jgi:hypothetical protein